MGRSRGPHSMLSLGSAAYTADKRLVSTFSANLEALPGAVAHPKTAEWWATQPPAWAACRKNLEPPERAMARYVAWIKSLNDKPVFVAYPAGFEFLFVCWYLMRLIGESPFGHSALDVKSFAMAVLKTGYRDSSTGTVLAGFDGVRGWVHHLAVHASYRRQGLARSLMTAAEKGLAALGCPKVNLQVRATNSAVVGFYRSLGYVVEDRTSLGKRLG
jgi:ribosomal protein S18 acetylase RimI-like enzyme